ncbi:MAG TPA: hypothetical protein VHI51_14625 [Ktedonobacterales bacterium]|nr:hypothetical protein [Ktedonobacterales bacterium]
MTWFSPMLMNTTWAADERAARSGQPHSVGIGSAWASGAWAWAGSAAQPVSATPRRAATTAQAGANLRAPVDLLARMSEVAQACGRSESDVWVEAAREWLRRREGEAGAAPVAPIAPAQAVWPDAPTRRSARRWDEIDALLIELRGAVAARQREGAPAA